MITADSTDEVDGTFRLILSIFTVENETEGSKDKLKMLLAKKSNSDDEDEGSEPDVDEQGENF